MRIRATNAADMVAISVAASLMFLPSYALAFSPHSPAANSPLFRQRPDHQRLPSSPTLLHVATPTASAAIDEAADANESTSFPSGEFNWFKVRLKILG